MGITAFPTRVPLTLGIESLSCSYDFGEIVIHSCIGLFRCTGTFKHMVTDMTDELIEDDEVKVKMLIPQH